ncbi:MAG: helix-turn-helix domain-containing protein, partial [Elusimicrobia bacterium]|nr:helix-turn-helix domain-containing protein [Elusimicrobiota bacterium]
LKNETGIAQTVISRWVRGESVPEFSSVEKLAKIFNLPIEYFIKDYKAEDNKKLIQIEEEKLKTLKEILDIQKELLKIAKVKK